VSLKNKKNAEKNGQLPILSNSSQRDACGITRSGVGLRGFYQPPIHFVEDDPIMPRRHGEVLYMALKKFGVPTEFIVYPNMGHGISDMRYQMVKMQAEFNWFEKWIRGKEGWIDWKKMIETLDK